MSEAPVNLGVVGAGTLAGRVMKHLSMPDVAGAARVVHICDPVLQRAEAMADAQGVPAASSSLEQLLEDPLIDAVTIASPIGLHHQQGLAAIASGRHVHFNKTMALTREEASELIDTAAAAGVHIVASPGEMIRPHNIRIRDLIQEDGLGTLCWAACGAALGTYHESEPEREQEGTAVIDPSWYFRKPGGGPLYDMTVYALHGLTGILGSVRRVAAMSGVRIPERHFGERAIVTEADDNSFMLLDFGENLTAFTYGASAGILSEGTGWDPTGRYYGTGGEIIGKRLNGEPLEYPGSALARTAGEDWVGDQWLLPHVGPEHHDHVEQHVFEDIMQLVDLIREGTPTPATPEHARHVIEIIEAAYTAASTGVTQDLTSTVEGLRETALDGSR